MSLLCNDPLMAPHRSSQPWTPRLARLLPVVQRDFHQFHFVSVPRDLDATNCGRLLPSQVT